MITKLAKILAGLALSSAVAHAVTIDFNALSGNLGASYTSGAVTFVPTAAVSLSAQLTPNGTAGLLAGTSPLYRTIRANIAGGTTSVSVDLGDYSGDADTIFLEIFNAASVSLGFTSQPLASNFTGMVTLSLSANDIAYAVFGATAPSVEGSSVYADNFTYVAARTPDAGSTLAFFGACLGLMGVAARARKSVR